MSSFFTVFFIAGLPLAYIYIQTNLLVQTKYQTFKEFLYMLGICQKYTKIFYASIWMPLSLLTFPFRQIDKLDCLEIVALEIILSDISHKYLFMSVYVNSLNVRRIFSEKSVNDPGGGAEIRDRGSRSKKSHLHQCWMTLPMILSLFPPHSQCRSKKTAIHCAETEYFGDFDHGGGGGGRLGVLAVKVSHCVKAKPRRLEGKAQLRETHSQYMYTHTHACNTYLNVKHLLAPTGALIVIVCY